jgi:hypothetical protein
VYVRLSKKWQQKATHILPNLSFGPEALQNFEIVCAGNSAGSTPKLKSEVRKGQGMTIINLGESIQCALRFGATQLVPILLNHAKPTCNPGTQPAVIYDEMFQMIGI